MKIKYNQALYIRFTDEKIEESDSEKPDVVLDYDAQGRHRNPECLPKNAPTDQIRVRNRINGR